MASEPEPPIPLRNSPAATSAPRGEAGGSGDLFALVYDELRRMAAAKMAHEAPGQTLQPTALVHEAWLRLGGDRQPHRDRAAAVAGTSRALPPAPAAPPVGRKLTRRADGHGAEFAPVRGAGTPPTTRGISFEALDDRRCRRP
ncbi:MAG: hypothetical protein FJ399_21625 [Verrucomicrobia bacterium]|nr:hypothetical protein [Verrucomicrobiota bacterium]